MIFHSLTFAGSRPERSVENRGRSTNERNNGTHHLTASSHFQTRKIFILMLVPGGLHNSLLARVLRGARKRAYTKAIILFFSLIYGC